MHLIVLLFPSLYKLKLDNNKIDDINKLKGLIGSKIEKISVKGNPFTIDNKDYVKQIFEMFPNIYSVDGFDKEGEIVNTLPSFVNFSISSHSRLYSIWHSLNVFANNG